jgi:hypothetical protein
MGVMEKMKVCPKCGFIDYSMWRQNRWRTNVEFLKMEYADSDMDPHVLAIVKREKLAIDKLYAYRLSNATQPIIKRVLRQEFDVSGVQAFHIPREKARGHNEDIFQSRLLEVKS